jgi:mono/diheme cytochrome c family protein
MRLVLIAVAAVLLGACRGNNPAYAVSYTPRVENGDPQRGRAVIEGYGCGGCHTIPGIRQANGLVGPPLLWWSRRTFIAGELPNTPENLVRWLRDPPSVERATAMPALGLSDAQARDAAAYLYTLR